MSEAEEALKQADIEGKKLIEEELMSEKPRLDQLREQLEKARSDAEDLHKAVLGQETHWYCSELLRFLSWQEAIRHQSVQAGECISWFARYGLARIEVSLFQDAEKFSFFRLPYLIFEVI